MKVFMTLLILTLAISVSASNAPPLMDADSSAAQSAEKETAEFRWDLLAAASGVVGLVLSVMPVVSLVGVVLGVVAMGCSYLAFRKKQNKRWAWLGMITGGLTVLVLFSVYGLIVFF